VNVGEPYCQKILTGCVFQRAGVQHADKVTISNTDF